jgi:hypothetical protein
MLCTVGGRWRSTEYWWNDNTEQQWKCFGGESSKCLLILGRWARIWQLKLLIGSTFKDLGCAPISTLYTAFGDKRLRAKIWQLLTWREWCSQQPGIASAYLLFIRRVKQCSGAKWMMKAAPKYCHSQRFAFQFLPGSCIVHTCVSHFKKLSFAAWSVYKCLKSFIL